jgi:rhamnogalacturonyl hydrolase YesR
MKALSQYQDENGMFREVIDYPGSYPEFSGTAMIATAMMRGIRRRTAICVRCTMINRAQPGLDRDINICKTLHRMHRGEAGMWTPVMSSGVISESEPVRIDKRV